MRHGTWIRPVLIACTLASLGAAANEAWPRGDEGDASTSQSVEPMSEAATPTAVDPDSLARVVALRDPLRATRLPASARYNPETAAPGAAPPPVVQRPALSLAGVLMGAEPAALVDGLPGAEGTRVLRVGERFGDYVVRRIAPDQVVIAGRDTTWTLRVRTRFQ